MNFTDKVVLVTGAGAGIGRAAAILYAKSGAKVAVNCLHEARGSETIAAMPEGCESLLVCGDVSNPEDAKRIIEAVVAHFGRLDILVNNAGIVLPGTIENTSLEDWDRTMIVNVRSVYLMSHLAIPHMKANGGGVIVNTSSSAAHKGVRDRCAYSASKGALLSLTRAMAIDLVPAGIRVNCVSPGTTDTPSLADRLNAFDDPEQARHDFVARQPMGRLGTSEEIAQAILFASSDEAAFMNGANLSIDGAMTC